MIGYFINDLVWAIDDQSLERAFNPYSEILESKIISDHETGRFRGFGFITICDEKSMRDAIEGMNGQILYSQNITVNQAQSRGSSGGGTGTEDSATVAVVAMAMIAGMEMVDLATRGVLADESWRN
uniref:RRM domain-containing protein n=1 Tax=Nelumbo nucifera TaxID=4432 RepID=A0A822Z1G0_NELNU|nr:TPA_asm: hypothetical protein HUJ06_007477 [Nelumbo nucifera]